MMIGGSSNRSAIGGDVANINMQKCNKSRIKLSILSISLFAMIMLWNGNDNDDISTTTSTSLFQRQLSLLQPFMDPKTTNLRQYPSTLQNLVLDSQDLESLSLDYGTCTNNSIVPENWCLDSHQTPRYVGNEGGKPSSVIQHYTHTGYEKCLAGKTVVLIGDSRVRYQFMHLAGYLASNKKMGCQDQQQTPDPECYLIDHEHQERVKRGDMGNEGWTSWYKKSTAMLQGYDDTTSLCDCYRPTGQPIKGYENRFIKKTTPFGEINLIFLQSYANRVRMNTQYPPFSSFTTEENRCKTGECGPGNRTDGFDGNVTETLWNILPRLNATHAFVNLGWEAIYGFEAQSDFSCEMQEFERQHPSTQLYLMSHPPPKSVIDNPLASFDAKKLKCDVGVLDRSITNKNVPHSWYWDFLHVLSILNEEYNHLLVEKICPKPISVPTEY